MSIISVPFSGGSLNKNRGCEFAPKEILRDWNSQILDVDNSDIKKTNEILENANGKIFVGGDHSITYSLFKGFVSNKKKGKVGLVIFDAHPDCVNDFTHEDFLRVLIEEKIVKPKNVLIIGLRKIDPIEQEFLNKYNIKRVLMKSLKNEYFFGRCVREIIDFVSNLESWYLSIDIDVLDPKYAPGTGYLEENGMALKDLLLIIEELSKVKNLGRIDIVEVNPLKDLEGKTVCCAREILRVLKSS